MPKARNIPENIWSHIERKDADSCWEYKGSRIRNYGVFRMGRRNYYAHRIVYELTHGAIPKGLYVLHKCDNPPCCNPEHLFLGTLKDNTNDMINKGRKAITNGTRNSNAKLTEQDVIAIRSLAHTGITMIEIGKRFGILHQQVSRIIQRKRWKHI